MVALSIRRLDDRVVRDLKRRARGNGTSMEEEARRSLTERVRRRKRNLGAMRMEFLRKVKELQKNDPDPRGSRAEDLIRRDRDHDHGGIP